MKNYLHMLRFIYGYTIHLDNIYGEMKYVWRLKDTS